MTNVTMANTENCIQRTYPGAGIILVRSIVNQEDRFLLLKGRDTGVWSFSKGHPEERDGEAPLRTAVRETFEETGLIAGKDYKIIGNSMRFGKRPYWIGVVQHADAPITLSPSEHTEAAWMSRNEIITLNTNTDVRAWLKKMRGYNSTFRCLMEAISSMKKGTQETRSTAPDRIAS